MKTELPEDTAAIVAAVMIPTAFATGLLKLLVEAEVIGRSEAKTLAESALSEAEFMAQSFLPAPKAEALLAIYRRRLRNTP